MLGQLAVAAVEHRRVASARVAAVAADAGSDGHTWLAVADVVDIVEAVVGIACIAGLRTVMKSWIADRMTRMRLSWLALDLEITRLQLGELLE